MKHAKSHTAANQAVLASACLAASTAFNPAWSQQAEDAYAMPASQPEPLATIAVSVPDAAEPAPTRAAPAEAPREIEEVIITATKRQQSVRDIPASINAISGQSLEEGGKLNLIDFIEQTPGVTATQGNSGYTRFTMRGISTDTGQTSPSPSPVGVFIGDTAFTDPYIANIVPDLSAFDLSGIQVLKGPQGTLFGGAALSGAVRYELQEPVIGEWQARGFTQMVSPKDGSTAFTSGAALNAPLNDDDLALRLVYVRRNYPGIFDDTRSGEKDVDHGSGNQYRGILLWKPEDWTFKLTHLSQDFYAPNAVYTTNTPDKREISSNIFEIPAKNSFGMDSLEGAYDFDSMRVTALSSYLFKKSVFNLDATSVLVGSPPVGYPPALGLLAPCTENSHAFSQELRLQSTGSDPFQWIVGGYFYTYSMYFNLLIDTPANQGLTGPDSALSDVLASIGLPGSLVGDNTSFFEGTSRVTSTERAAFFDLSYRLFDRLDLSAGARLYWTEVKGGFIATGLLLRLENNGMDADTRNQLSEHGINPKFTATYHFTDDISLYSQVAKGFRFGGIQYVPSTPTNGVPETFKSDTLWNYELGLRTSWFDRTLNADLTAFYIRYNNPIITQATPGISINYNDNVSSAISRGIETSLLWNTPLPGLRLSLKGALTDAHITSPFEATGGVQIDAGQQMPGVAPQQVNATIEYFRPVGPVNIGSNVGYTYVGQGFGDLAHSIEINGFGSLDAGLIFSSDALPLHPKLAINVTNILDATKPTAGGTAKPIVPVSELSLYSLNAPRTLSLRVSLDF